MRIGYARVSTAVQNLDMQKKMLLDAGCERILTDVASGKRSDRPGLEQLKSLLRSGDTVVVWRLDRLGRSLKDLIELVAEFESQGVGFHSLQEAIDTTTSGGKLTFHLFGALAEFERNLIRERTMAGLEAARARGRKGGRRKSLSPLEREMVVDLYRLKKHSVRQICHEYQISKPTLYAYVREAEIRK